MKDDLNWLNMCFLELSSQYSVCCQAASLTRHCGFNLEYFRGCWLDQWQAASIPGSTNQGKGKYCGSSLTLAKMWLLEPSRPGGGSVKQASAATRLNLWKSHRQQRDGGKEERCRDRPWHHLLLRRHLPTWQGGDHRQRPGQQDHALLCRLHRHREVDRRRR